MAPVIGLHGRSNQMKVRKIILCFVYFACFLILFLQYPPDSFAQRRPVLRPVRRDYFAGKFLLIPGDDLPTSTQMTRMIAAVSDHDLVLPSDRLIGDAGKLLEWAGDLDYDDIDGAVISFDAFLQKRSGAQELIGIMRGQRPGLQVYGFVTLSQASEGLVSSLMESVAGGFPDYLLIAAGEGDEPVSAQIRNRIQSLKLNSRVALTNTTETAAIALLTRMTNRRFGYSPKLLPIYSSKPDGAASHLITDQITLMGATEIPQTSEAARSVEVLLFIHTPETDDQTRAAFASAIAQSLERNVRVAVLDLAESDASKDKLLTKLREKKLLDKLTSYASSDSAGAKLEIAAAESIAHACSFQISIRFLRDDLDRVMRIDRAQVSLQLGQYLSDWAFPLKVRPGQENLQEASVLDRVKVISDEIFTEQFRRNLHAFLLTTGERAQLEVRMIQRLQLKLFRAPGAPAQEVFVRPSVYLVFLGSQPTSQIKANTSWELTSEDVDDRISRRWSMINWLSFRSDAEMVEMSIRVSPKNAPQLSSDQGYSIRSKRTRSTRKIEILAAANEGAFNALARLERMGLEGRIAEDFQLTESPALKYRALIEDRAISRMTHRDRLEMMQLLGRLRLNRLYFFGNGYKPEKIVELIRAANANFVELVYVFKAASMTPVEEIENEISQLRQGGVRSFALNFESTGDRTRISADAALIAGIRSSLQTRYPDSRLSVILRSAAPEDKYVSEIAQAISPDMELVIADDTITGESSSLLNKRIVSVTALTSLSGNSRTESTQCFNLLPGSYHNPGSPTEGVSTRLTQQTRMSLMLLPSFAEFAWEPASYNSRSSFDQTLNLLFDERSRNGIRSWAQVVGDCSRDNPLSAISIKNSPVSAARKLADLRSAIEQLNGTPERGLLRAELAELIARAQTVLDKFKSR